ncbi:MAG: TonB-dependent receptor plug domain-containing protein, partial [Woeseiaceae bacterium]
VATVIDEFRSAGHPFAYSTNLVRPDMLVEAEPAATEPVDIVREILAPYHLAVREEQGFLLIVRADTFAEATGSLLLIVRDDENWRLLDNARVTANPELPTATMLGSGVYQYPALASRDYKILVEVDGFEPGVRTVRVRSGKPTMVEVELHAARSEIEMITVSSSRYDIWSDLGSSPFVMSQLSIQNLPDIGDDPLRAVQVLPGMASTGVSARTYFRGGEYRETSVFLNGNKLLDPYHARDFQNIFSTVDSRIIESIEIYTGSLPLRYGEQLSGAVFMNTIDPSVEQRNELGISAYNTSALLSGALSSGRGGWLVSARRGNLDLLIKPSLGTPRYHDLFGTF